MFGRPCHRVQRSPNTVWMTLPRMTLNAKTPLTNLQRYSYSCASQVAFGSYSYVRLKDFPMTSSDKENIVVKMEEDDGEFDVILATKLDDSRMDVLDDVLVKDTAPPGLHDTVVICSENANQSCTPTVDLEKERSEQHSK